MVDCNDHIMKSPINSAERFSLHLLVMSICNERISLHKSHTNIDIKKKPLRLALQSLTIDTTLVSPFHL